MEQFPAVMCNPSRAAASHAADDAATGRSSERLPFTVRRVDTEADLSKAVRVRHAAYRRHVPEFAERLARPEAADYAGDTIVLLAESRLDGSPLGSTRIRTNAQRPLDIEESVVLPAHLQGKRLVEAVRLGVDDGGIGRLVKMALIKACLMVCENDAVDYSVAAGRPAVARQYGQLMFVDLFPGEPPIPLRHAGDIPHRILACEIAGIGQRWAAARHPLHGFFFGTHHPDIDVAPREATDCSSMQASCPAAPAMLPVRREMALA